MSSFQSGTEASESTESTRQSSGKGGKKGKDAEPGMVRLLTAGHPRGTTAARNIATPGGSPTPNTAEDELQWPWAELAAAWMGSGRDCRERAKSTFRRHYMQPDLILYDARKWKSVVMTYAPAFATDTNEAMVQMLVTVLSRDASTKDPADDRVILAASLRHKHSPEHFTRMFEEMDTHWAKLGCGPITSLVKLFEHGPASMRLLSYSLSSLGVSLPPMPARMGGAEVWTGVDTSLWDKKLLETNPLDALLIFCKENRMRLLDVFNRIDTDKSGDLELKELETALIDLKIPLSHRQIRDLITNLDADGDGKIDYKEMVAGRRESVLRIREQEKSSKKKVASIATVAAMQTDAKRRVQQLRDKAMTEPTVDVDGSAAKVDVQAAKSSNTAGPKLWLDPVAFTDLVLHCHYVTRP